MSPEASEAFLEIFIDSEVVRIIYPDEELEQVALDTLRKTFLARKGFSYTDALTVTVIRKLKICYLPSYNVRSFSGLISNIVGINYWSSLLTQEQQKMFELLKKGCEAIYQ